MNKINPKQIFSSEVEFLYGAHNYSQIKKSLEPEIAFIGASNVGKSSLINAILGKKIAITSSTPGRTRQLNFFKITTGFTQKFSQGFVLVDMPGYGYAKGKDKHIEHWQKLSLEYLMNRINLKRLYLLIDPKKGLKAPDLDMINMLNATAVSFQIILTKADKISLAEIEVAKNKILEKSKKWGACHPEILSLSSLKSYGIKDIQDSIINLLQTL